jgi:hypothetical protein
MFFEVFTGIEGWSRFQHHYAQAAFGEDLRRRPAGSS